MERNVVPRDLEWRSDIKDLYVFLNDRMKTRLHEANVEAVLRLKEESKRKWMSYVELK